MAVFGNKDVTLHRFFTLYALAESIPRNIIPLGF